MNNFIYNDVSWKVFGIVNDGTIFNHLNTKEENKKGLWVFLHNTLGIMNYTALDGPIHYEINESEKGYSIFISWNSTKMKAETTYSYLESIKKKEQIDPGKTEWRNMISAYLSRLFETCAKIDYSFIRNTEKTYSAKLFAEISFDKLYSDTAAIDKPIESIEVEEKEFSVPYEIIANIITENTTEAIKYFGKDHHKVISILEPLSGKEFIADFLIGTTYYMYLKMPQKAYSYFQRALKLLNDEKSPSAAILLDFMGNIELFIKKNPEDAEQTFIKSIILGNEKAFLKLAYMYIQQAQIDKKTVALNLVEIGEQILIYEENELQRLAGYHIAASVYLWNDYYKEAAAAHNKFLANDDWINKNLKFVEAYLIFAIAKNNEDFISNLITDFSIILKQFSLIIDTWHCCFINPKDERFNMQMVPILNLINNTKRIYGF